MKKLLAIAVIFALVAGAAFAEVTVSGSVEARWRIFGNTDSDVIQSRGRAESGSIRLSGTDDEGVYGGQFNMAFAPDWIVRNVTYDAGGPGVNVTRNFVWSPNMDRAFIWWQPIDQLRIWMGRDGDGMFNPANITRWGFHRMDRGVSVENWDGSDYLIGNWDVNGIAFIITPMDGLAINAALGLEWDEPIERTFANRLQLQVAYSADFGNFTVTYQARESAPTVNNSNIGATFSSGSLVDGLEFEVGVAYNMREGNNDPIRFGLGVEYKIEDFGVKLRALMHPREAFFFFKVDVMPYYVIDGIGTIFCNFRFAQEANEVINWHVNPYFRKTFGGSDFRVGALFSNSGVSGAPTNWVIATSMVFAF